MRLTGYAALRAKELDPSVTLNHYETPLIDERNDISFDDARDIAHDDPGLIWTDTVPDCVRRIIVADPVLSAWVDATEIPAAALYRVSVCAVGDELDESELELIAMLEPEPTTDICHSPRSADALHYLVFRDGSLYVETNGQDEVWSNADDFVQERIVNGKGALDLTTSDLLRHLGNYDVLLSERGAHTYQP